MMAGDVAVVGGCDVERSSALEGYFARGELSGRGAPRHGVASTSFRDRLVPMLFEFECPVWRW